MSRNEIKPDAYLENAARQLVALNQELSQPRQYERVKVIEPDRSYLTRRVNHLERYYAVYSAGGVKHKTECVSLYCAQQLASRYKGKAIAQGVIGE